MIDQDLMDTEAAPQPSSSFGFGAYPGANGFDFGLSQPKTGLGYGLLGDTRSLANDQSCADCPPSDPCPNCSGDDADPQGRIIKTQVPMPMPGWFPPPPPIITPAHPQQTPIIGDPSKWWNWTPDEWARWAHGVFESRGPSKAVEKICEDQAAADDKRCEALARKTTAEAGRARGARELDSCMRHTQKRYADCRRNNGKTNIPPYPDWYEDPPYPDDFEDPYPG